MVNPNRLNNIERQVHSELLPTWQPVAAIAYRAKLSVKSVLKALLDMEGRGIVKKARTRIDGHNKVHLFKKLDYVKVMGMQMPCPEEVEEV